jgi:hypothetical protein
VGDDRAKVVTTLPRMPDASLLSRRQRRPFRDQIDDMQGDSRKGYGNGAHDQRVPFPRCSAIAVVIAFVFGWGEGGGGTSSGTNSMTTVGRRGIIIVFVWLSSCRWSSPDALFQKLAHHGYDKKLSSSSTLFVLECMLMYLPETLAWDLLHCIALGLTSLTSTLT